MMRSIGAVLAGSVLWTVLWLGSTSALTVVMPDRLPAGEPVTDAAVLVALVVISVVFSVAAGYLTGLLARSAPVRHALWLGVLQLALGIGFEVSAWGLTPVWYHLVFLALLLPGNVAGGWLRGERVPAAPRPVRAAI